MSRKLILIIIGLMSLIACDSVQKTNNKQVVAVSIPPIAFIVEQIADSNVEIVITVPETTSPETYEMTSNQLTQISDAKLYLAIGLIDFEMQLEAKIKQIAPRTKYINLSQGIELVEGSCGHNHHIGHSHLVDPHIWLSVKNVKTMAQHIAKQLVDLDPKNQQTVENNLIKFIAKMDLLDSVILSKSSSCINKNFAIVHPSLTYFARDYGLKQIAIEQDGKDPSVKKTKEIIDQLTLNEVNKVLFSRQNPDASARQIASQINAKIVEYDPLKRQWDENMMYLIEQLCN